MACADREEEIAKRVESLNPYASAIRDKLPSGNPELLDLNRTLFEGRPLKIQFAMQAAGERAGAAALEGIRGGGIGSVREGNAAKLQPAGAGKR